MLTRTIFFKQLGFPLKYLSIDIEATGLNEDSFMIELAFIPMDAAKRTLEMPLARQFYIQCPSFNELASILDPWVIQHNRILIEKAHKEGISLSMLKQEVSDYVTSTPVKNYFDQQKIIIFGKSLNAIDLPFLVRDLGFSFIREHFSHRQMDLSSFVYGLIDFKALNPGHESGSKLMQYLGMGEVAHTALEDAINTANMYFKLLDIIPRKMASIHLNDQNK